MATSNPALYRICGRTVYRHHLLYAGAGLSLAFGMATLSLLPSKDQSSTPRRSSTNPEAQAGRQRAAAMEMVIAETRRQPVRHRVEAAFDGAVQTHEIGFPTEKR